MHKVDKSKITIIILAVVFALSLSVTITLAAFSANKTGDLTLTFADGLTMRLDPIGTNGRVQITAADENATTFIYSAVSNATSNVMYDGIEVTVNKDCYIGFRIELQEMTSGSPVAPAGAWERAGRYTTFTPTAEPSDWLIAFFSGNNAFCPRVSTNNVFECITNTLNTATSSPIKIIECIDVRGGSKQVYVDALSGRSFRFLITIKARTDSAPTF